MRRLSPEARETALRIADQLGPDGSLQLAMLIQEIAGTGSGSAVEAAHRSIEVQDILYALAMPRNKEEEPSCPKP